MKKEELECYLGRQIKLILKNNYYYSGKIKSLDQDSLLLIDKFGSLVTIPYEEISLITEVREE